MRSLDRAESLSESSSRPNCSPQRSAQYQFLHWYNEFKTWCLSLLSWRMLLHHACTTWLYQRHISTPHRRPRAAHHQSCTTRNSRNHHCRHGLLFARTCTVLAGRLLASKGLPIGPERQASGWHWVTLLGAQAAVEVRTELLEGRGTLAWVHFTATLMEAVLPGSCITREQNMINMLGKLKSTW